MKELRKLSLPWSFGLFLFLCLLTQVAGAQSVSAALSKNEILIGDQIKMELDISYPAGMTFEVADLSGIEKTEGIELLNVYPVDTVPSNEGNLLHQTLILTSFDSGQYLIPQIPVSFLRGEQRQTINTNTLLLIVNPYPVSQDTVQLQPIKGIIAEEKTIEDYLPVLIGIVAVALLTFLGFFLYRRSQNREEPEPLVIRRPPYEVAMSKIEALRSSKLWQQNKIKVYQSELTFILREYLEDRFKVKALESTTDEIIESIDTLEVDEKWLDELKKILQTADLVKFAKAIPPIEVHAAGLDKLENFVVETQPSIEEQDPELLEAIQQHKGAVIYEQRDSSAYAVVEQADADEVSPVITNKREIARFWPRWFAYVLDTNISIFSGAIVGGLLFAALGFDDVAYLNPYVLLFAFVYLWAYNALLISKKGATPGKMLLKLKVIDEDGNNLSLGRATLRYVVKNTISMIFLIGFAFFFFNKKKRQTLHDLAGKSFVIKKPASLNSDQVLDFQE